MSETGYQRPWKMYTSSNQIHGGVGDVNSAAVGLKGFGTSSSSTSSMNAVSFGFMATALLISMFLIMAILEHIFRPKDNGDNTTASGDQSLFDDRNINGGRGGIESGLALSGTSVKLQNHQQHVLSSSGTGFSVLMPGERYPTCIAQPAPLPCSRESVYWPSHQTQQ